jgi:hypothetical protein
VIREKTKRGKLSAVIREISRENCSLPVMRTDGPMTDLMTLQMTVWRLASAAVEIPFTAVSETIGNNT